MLPRAVSRPAAAKAPVRDKRYNAPTLLVDVLETAHETTLWSASQLIVPKYTGDLRPGDRFTGAFRFDGEDDCGLFEAAVAKHDAARQLLGVRLGWVSAPGAALLRAMDARRDPAAPELTPRMTVMLTHGTIDWSFSGMKVAGFRGAFRIGQVFRGLIRAEKAQSPGMFEATVARIDTDAATATQSLALKFRDLPTATFAMLEAALKKNGPTQCAA